MSKDNSSRDKRASLPATDGRPSVASEFGCTCRSGRDHDGSEFGACEFCERVASQRPSRKITTEHVYPPIPIRCYDWRACFGDMDEETRGNGWGATEAEAIADLKEIYGIECRQCGKHESEVLSCQIGGCPIGADL